MTGPVQLNAHVEGEGGEVVLLHGLFGSARNWLGVQRVLAARWRVHALDLRNHGGSAWAEPMDYPSMAADVAAYCERHCAAAPVLLGHSMGGKVAMTCALGGFVQLRGLIVVDIAPTVNPPTLSPVLSAMRSIDPGRATRRQEVGEWLAPDVPDERVRAFLLQNLVSKDGRLRWRINLEAIARGMPAILGFPEPAPGNRYEEAALFIAGGQSDYVLARHEAQISALFPRARIERIADAGHWVHADQPQQFLELVQDELSR